MKDNQSATRTIRVLGFGKYAFPTDKFRPYYASLDLKGDGVGILQPMNAEEFFKLINSLCEPRKEACGQSHVPTVTVPA